MPSLLRRLRSRLSRLLRRADIDDELGFHVEQLTADNIRAGMAPAEARRQALLALGGVQQTKEAYRDEFRVASLLDDLAHDLRYGLRQLRRAPGFAIVAVATLALGIGANTAIFSLVNSVLLRPLPFAEPGRLVLLLQSHAQRGLPLMNLSQANYVTYREQAGSFEGLAAYTSTEFNLSGRGAPERLNAAQVSANFFDVLGVAPVLGRGLRAGEDAPGRRQFALLSYGYWQQQFGGRRDIVGQTLLLNSVPTEVIGVMPPGFAFPNQNTQLWVPLDLDRQRTSPFLLRGIGRLRPGVTDAQAQAETTHIVRTQAASNPSFVASSAPPPAGSDLRTAVTPLQEAVTGRARTPLLVLLGAVGLVLLIACANLATLLLSRGAARAREISVRVALGASRARIVRQLLTECLVVGLLGCGAGVALARMAAPLVNLLPPGSLPRFTGLEIDAAVLGFAFAAGLGTTLLFGLVPSTRVQRLGVQASMQSGERTTATRSIRRTNAALVVVQFALSLVLVVGTGLLLRTFQRLMSLDPGFAPEHLLTMRLYVHPEKDTGYRNPFAPPPAEEGERVARFYRDAVERVRALPGVQAAAVVSDVPFGAGGNRDGIVAKGHEPQEAGAAPVRRIRLIGPGYFAAMKIPFLGGRDFEERDRRDSPPVAIVDDSFARRYWPDGDAVGRQIRYSWNEEPDAWMTIVGVVAAIRDNTLAGEKEPNVYLPHAQEPSRAMSLVTRTSGDPTAAASSVRAALREVNAAVPAYEVRTMDEVIASTLFRQRFTGSLLAVFAAIALALAAIGIYGVVSLEVTGRMKEMAIRMALGAQPAGVFALIMRRGAVLAGIGVAAGIGGAIGLTRLLSGLLFGVSPLDAVSFLAGAVVLGFIAALGCYVPARRAARVDPMTTLRWE